jgi:twitching motility protein PilT
MARIDAFFKLMSEEKASDLHLATNNPPMLRINGELVRVDYPALQNDDLKAMVYEIAPEGKIKVFEETSDVDFGYEVPGVARYRANFFQQKYGISAVFRLIPSKILTVDELGLPPVLKKFPLLKKGLILVTGPTGSGKSTTLAAMMDYANLQRHDHVITVEDPIEFVHRSQNCLVQHREVGVHTRSFASALRGALREDPDILLVGEMRDLETIESALRIAETGHLTFATLHTNSAAQTINRIIDVFPSHQQGQIRTQLSLVIEGIVCQSLLPRADGKGRVVSLEILVPNPAIRNLIREDKVHQIYSMMQTGQDKYGMQTFNQALASLYHQKQISAETALQRSSNVDELKELMDRGSGVNTGNGGHQPPSPGNHPSPYAQARPVGARPTITK